MTDLKSCLLDRKTDEVLARGYSYCSEKVDELVDEGIKTLSINLSKEESTLTDLVIFAVYRRSLDLIDSISQLIKIGTTDTAQVLVRALFECSLYFEYLLQSNTEQKALCYRLINEMEKLDELKKVNLTDIKETPIIKNNKKLLGNIDFTNFYPQESINILEIFFSNKKYVGFVNEYRNCKKKNKNKSFNWFTMYNGPKSISDLAKTLDRGAEYKILYSGWSEVVHSRNTHKNSFEPMGNQMVGIYPLRSNSHMDEVFRTTIVYFIRITKLFIARLQPEQQTNFDTWHKEFRKDIMPNEDE